MPTLKKIAIMVMAKITFCFGMEDSENCISLNPDISYFDRIECYPFYTRGERSQSLEKFFNSFKHSCNLVFFYTNNTSLLETTRFKFQHSCCNYVYNCRHFNLSIFLNKNNLYYSFKKIQRLEKVSISLENTYLYYFPFIGFGGK